MVTSIPFELRGLRGRVEVEYLVNDDPARWGYPILGLEAFDVERARGCPVTRATVAYPAEGYAAEMAWIQVVEHGAEPTVIVDVAPQMHASEAAMPYMAWGVRPEFFDAPATDDPEYAFRAVAFLTASPDALMTPVVGALCGFTWGYRIVASRPEPTPLAPASPGDWAWARQELEDRYPAWTFLDLGWSEARS